MTNNTYSGWKNRETWLVNLWYGHHWTCGEDVHATRYQLEDMAEALGNGIFQDMLDLDCIDWAELFGHAEEKSQELS